MMDSQEISLNLDPKNRDTDNVADRRQRSAVRDHCNRPARRRFREAGKQIMSMYNAPRSGRGGKRLKGITQWSAWALDFLIKKMDGMRWRPG